MADNLVIVESPAKAKTIGKYLGKDFVVKSSFGHIRDLPSSGLSIDIEDNFKPQYEISPDKKKVVSELKKAAKQVNTVWLASDEDREGEAIAWHLVEAIGLSKTKTKRIVFHEITKSAIDSAIKNPRPIDEKLVDAQQARRVLDRLVGYELSPVLWKKIQRGLSAGRVQSVAVRLIVEREREITNFQSKSSFKINGTFIAKNNEEFTAEYDSKPTEADRAEKILKSCMDKSFTVDSVTNTPGRRNPSAPFTTSTLQQEASRRLGFSVRQTMTLAQRLYESGHITYMRTDSTTLSQEALQAAAKVVAQKYGAHNHQLRQYRTKSRGAQEAHEAIRPSDLSKEAAGNDERQRKLYALIWQRSVASQMKPAVINKTVVTISAADLEGNFTAKGEVIESPGWMISFPQNFHESTLPKLQQGDRLVLQEAVARETFSRPPARYTEASLVRKLEELGIGRPSTYSPTISVIQDRGYVVKGSSDGEQRSVKVYRLSGLSVSTQTEQENFGADKNKLLPTDIAGVVIDFLVEHFSEVLDYDFTAQVEGQFDAIAEGTYAWQEVISSFYSNFHNHIMSVENIAREDAGGQRQLGEDPSDGKPVVARIGRYGPMLQKGLTSDKEKPTFAPLPEGAKLETITLEEALPMFKLPRTVGKTATGEEIVAGIGRYGPYINVAGSFTSIRGHDPHTIDEKTARTVLSEKEQKNAKKVIKEFKKDKIRILRGQYGPYVTDGKINAKIAKDMEPESLSLSESKKLLAAKKSRKQVSPKKRK